MPVGVSSPEIHSWCWEEKALVTVGFTAPAPSISHWAPTTSPVSYLILTPASQLPAMALSQDQSHPVPSLLCFFL